MPEPSADLITENEAETSENLPALAENDVQDLQPSIVAAGIGTHSLEHEEMWPRQNKPILNILP